MSTTAAKENTQIISTLTRRPAFSAVAPEDTEAEVLQLQPQTSSSPSDPANPQAIKSALEENDIEQNAIEQNAIDPERASRALVVEMTRTISIAALEVMNGSRSIQQLARWLDIKCFSALTTRARLHAEACALQERRASPDTQRTNVVALHRKPVIHSIHSFPVSPGIYETNVVVADGARFRAMALRMEESRGIWKVTALRIG